MIDSSDAIYEFLDAIVEELEHEEDPDSQPPCLLRSLVQASREEVNEEKRLTRNQLIGNAMGFSAAGHEVTCNLGILGLEILLTS